MMELQNYRIYISYNNVGNPYHVRMAFKYYYKYLKYSYVLRNNWTGMGARRNKLKSVIDKAVSLAKYHASKHAGNGNQYKIVEGRIGDKSLYFLEVWSNKGKCCNGNHNWDENNYCKNFGCPYAYEEIQI